MNEEVTNKVFTLANIISFSRLILAFVAFGILLSGNNVLAAILFGVTAATDFLDGQIARRTHTVSRIGQLLDPAVDRVWMVLAVVGLLIMNMVPLWIVLVVLVRDALLLGGGAWLLKKYNIRIPVIYPGKVATTFLFVGLAGQMLNIPQIPGLGWCDYSWLPGFNMMSTSWGIWLIYVGILLAIATTIYYIVAAVRELRKALA